MPGSTPKGVPYSLGTDTADTIDTTMQSLAEWVDARPGVSALTDAMRGALAAKDLWDGRVIWNVTAAELQRYNAGTATWSSTLGLVRNQLASNSKVPADAPSTYPFGRTTHANGGTSRPEWGTATGVVGSYVVTTERAATGYAEQRARKVEDGRTFVRTGSADDTGWGVFRETVRAAGEDVVGAISVAPGHNLRGALLMNHGMLAKNGTDGGDTYPFGTSAFVYGSGATGWPESFGMVITHHYQSDGGRLFQEVLGTSGTRYTRRWNPGAAPVWQPFRTDPTGDFVNAVVNAQTTSTGYVDTPSGPSFTFTGGPMGKAFIIIGGGLANSGNAHTILAPHLTRVDDGVVTMSAQDRYSVMHYGTQVGRFSKIMQLNLTHGAAYTLKTQMRVATSGTTGTVNEPQVGVISL